MQVRRLQWLNEQGIVYNGIEPAHVYICSTTTPLGSPARHTLTLLGFEFSCVHKDRYKPSGMKYIQSTHPLFSSASSMYRLRKSLLQS